MLYVADASKADELYIREHNCQPLKTLPYKWPLALDLLYTAYLQAMEGRILRFFTNLVQSMPPTFEQKLLGLSGIDTVDPKNIEAVLSTQFNGTSTACISHILIFSYSHILIFSYSHILIFSYSHILIFSYSHILIFS
jgi:hypothetical protein